MRQISSGLDFHWCVFQWGEKRKNVELKTNCVADCSKTVLAIKSIRKASVRGKLGRGRVWGPYRIFTNWFHWNKKRCSPLNYFLKNKTWLNYFRLNFPRPTAETLRLQIKEILTLANIALHLLVSSISNAISSVFSGKGATADLFLYFLCPLQCLS